MGKDGDALKDVTAAGDEDNADARKLFAGANGNAAVGADVADIAKAAGAVTAVSGEQILKAIVDAAGDENQAGAKAADAKNPIAAAIGDANDGAAEFGENEMKKRNDKIAAAIVLRGVAKSGKFAVANADNDNKASVKSAVESAVDEVSKWLEEMIKAAEDAATKGGTGEASEKIGDSANQGAVADADSVKGIAKGIKGIVDAAGKAFGKDGDALKDVTAAADEANAAAGKLFAGNAAGADAGDIAKAAGAVSAVSGEQILKAIVDAAGDENQAGKKAEEAKNPIAAAIGDANDAAANGFGKDEMKKRNDKIAAAIVLRGVAKSGKFAVADNADNSKASVKSAVESAVDEVSKWLEEMIKAAGKALGKDGALKDVTAADGEANADAGKLFATQAGANAGAGDIAKAAAAVTAVSGEQILKAIVDAAGAANQVGKKAEEAKNPIAAAIGTADAGAAEFGQNEMKKSDKIAAAIVLRGVAKDGKFAVANANDNSKESVKSAVESAVGEVSGWLKEMITAAGEAAKVDNGSDGKIGDSAANNAGKADKDSVNGIAKGIKGIVAAAGKALGKEGALKGVKEAAAGDKDQDGVGAGAATNPIEAAIGDAGQGAAFGEDMKKSDKIAAAIVLRGVAKDGKFAVAADADNGKKESVKSAVESAVDEVSAWLKEMITAAAEAAKVDAGGADKIGDVGADNKGAVADANSVKEIAKGIKGIVAAAGKALGGSALKDVTEVADDNAANAVAGKLFAGNAAGADVAAADIAKAAAAVTAVSGEQILKAIVDAAGDKNQDGMGAGAATNPIEAAIGDAGQGAAFGNDMKKSDKIAAAIVLRGVAKGGKFAVANADNDGKKESVKSAVESAVDEVSGWLEEMITAAEEAAKVGGTGGADKIGDSAANNAGKADESSVKGIAKGIKGIVAAAGKALGKEGNALTGVASC
ncbi:Outer surface protein VlsE (plasmid) [Borreliella afzelii PKo]|uniref:Outer surface protein VlsE n=1 Tax=Borreliella afzelii (strain PKo) TaxID=390236 RepID=G0ITS4_BORAP|nr:Outer surface protein VlsE [Borreliella afzelii PKo]